MNGVPTGKRTPVWGGDFPSEGKGNNSRRTVASDYGKRAKQIKNSENVMVQGLRIGKKLTIKKLRNRGKGGGTLVENRDLKKRKFIHSAKRIIPVGGGKKLV